MRETFDIVGLSVGIIGLFVFSVVIPFFEKRNDKISDEIDDIQREKNKKR